MTGTVDVSPEIPVREVRSWHLENTYRRIIEELAEEFLPEAGRTEAVKEHVVRHIDSWVPHLPEMFRRTFRLGLLLLQWGTVLTLQDVRPFTLASRSTRRRYLRQWESSPVPIFRALVSGVRGLVLSGYYSIPSVYRHLGYTPRAHVERCIMQREALVEALGHIDNHTTSMIFENIGKGDAR